jgi:hypothetical protein
MDTLTRDEAPPPGAFKLVELLVVIGVPLGTHLLPEATELIRLCSRARTVELAQKDLRQSG